MADTTQECVLKAHGLCSAQGTGRQRIHCTGLKEDCSFKHDSWKIKRQIKSHQVSISSVAASKIASGYNQTATAIFVGKRGKGKSYAAGSVMESYARKVAVMLGSNPWEADPDQYFPIKGLPHAGIINEEDIMRSLELMREPGSEYGGFILDDVGKFLDAREFMTKKNKIVNKIFQTVRTKHVFTEITIPDDSGLDKDPRENSDFFCIMEQSLHDHGLSVGRFFEQNKQYRSGKMWYVYLRQKGSPVVRHAFKSPSEQFSAEYEPRRMANADKLFEESMEELKELIATKNNGSSTSEIMEVDNEELNKALDEMRDIIASAKNSDKKIPKRAFLPAMDKVAKATKGHIPTSDMCKKVGVDYSELRRYRENKLKR